MVSDGGMAGLYGAYFSAIKDGADALLTYYGCKKGNSDDCEGGKGPKYPEVFETEEEAREAAVRASGDGSRIGSHYNAPNKLHCVYKTVYRPSQ